MWDWYFYEELRSVIVGLIIMMEGGGNTVATANILETSTPVVDGKQYHLLYVLMKAATIKDGKLYICKAQAGCYARKFAENASSSFSPEQCG